MKSCQIKFWGVRGSIPTPGASTLRYGGNTSCVELQFADGPLFILDAGTGIRALGNSLLKNGKPVNGYIFISHFHWDHIQGLPFFRPAYDNRNSFLIAGSDDTSINLADIISFQMDPTYFPITIDDMKADIQFRSIREEKFEIEGVEIQTMYLNHPGYALGFRFSYRGKSVVYISDNEPFHTESTAEENVVPMEQSHRPDKIFDSFVESKDDRLIQFCRKTDILIHDTQFFPEEYQERKTWGHSPFNYTVDLAIKSEVKYLVLFHHDPDHNDETIDKILKLSKELLQKSGKSITCQAAQEGLVLTL
jgi:phosphoribosyl 1,2-cyclic phosphodiesterase